MNQASKLTLQQLKRVQFYCMEITETTLAVTSAMVLFNWLSTGWVRPLLWLAIAVLLVLVEKKKKTTENETEKKDNREKTVTL